MRNKSEFKTYEIITLEGLKLTFKFALEKNPVNGLFEPHIWIRHTIEPEQVITAFLNKSEETYNKKYQRFEAYSETEDIYFWYAPYKKNMPIMIITAFNEKNQV